MPMTEQHWTTLARYLRELLPRAAPDWTTSNSHDPGITVLEVLNYALTDLQFRRPLDENARALSRGIASQATALAQAYGASPPRHDPYANFRFRVQWEGRYVAGVDKLSALKRTTDAIEYREGDGEAAPARRLPGPTHYHSFTLQRGITTDREFEDWANAASGAGAAPPLKDVLIELLDEGGQVFRSYRAWGCWVSQYQALPDLDAHGPGVLIETLRLECEGWQRIDGA